MKTAREQAERIVDLFDLPQAYYSTSADAVEEIIKEAIRDQRHICAETVYGVNAKTEDASWAVSEAHSHVLNAPFPGEG